MKCGKYQRIQGCAEKWHVLRGEKAQGPLRERSPPVSRICRSFSASADCSTRRPSGSPVKRSISLTPAFRSCCRVACTLRRSSSRFLYPDLTYQEHPKTKTFLARCFGPKRRGTEVGSRGISSGRPPDRIPPGLDQKHACLLW